MKPELKPKQWFLDRVGKRVFRDGNGCKCQVCEHIEENGLVIFDEDQAEYMFDMQNDLYFDDGITLNYRDQK